MGRRKKSVEAQSNTLNAASLKGVLWETMNSLRANNIDPKTANAIASQSREIMRVVKMELTVAAQAGKSVSPELLTSQRTLAQRPA